MNEFTELTRQKVIEDVGVDMNLIQGGDNWKQQLALYITGGDVPDLVAFMDASTFQGYAAEGAFYDLTDLIGNYPNIMAYLSTVSGYTAEDMLKRTSIDGRIYGIPSVTIARSYYTENIRTDWLENLGLECLLPWRTGPTSCVLSPMTTRTATDRRTPMVSAAAAPTIP